MAGSEATKDPGKAQQLKEEGNRHFQHGDYKSAESLYTKAILYDSENPLLYTNRAMALLKLSNWEHVIKDSNRAIELLPENMKAYYYLAQAQIALHRPSDAYHSAKHAHLYCVQELRKGEKGGGSIGVITDLVLRAKLEDWEQKEDERLKRVGGLLQDLTEKLKVDRDAKISGGQELEDIENIKEYETKIEDLRKTFEIAGQVKPEEKRRKVPDWCIDTITFRVMIDPVITKTGQSYDRSSIMEHLKRSPTDPLTREPLRAAELRPNIALRQACEEFLQENGWAADW
ncbi:U-box domain-containing protein [Halenospora varia]|nr:U-box domain-containing protein [Halenospora varia]